MAAKDEDPDEPDKIAENMEALSRMKAYYARPTNDILYRSDCLHVDGPGCDNCEISEQENRDEREMTHSVKAHYGNIASGNSVIKDAVLRDKYAADSNILCFEMEATGLMNTFPCLVIRGICDYCDSHKNDAWHKYAALTASAYAKELLHIIQPGQVHGMELAARLTESINEIKGNIKRMEQEKKKEDIYRWLSPPDPESNYPKALKTRKSGTGTWFIQSQEFEDWKLKKSPFLWLHGIPGCGKTVLSSTVIEEIRTMIVIDALDECDNRGELLKTIKKMSGWGVQRFDAIFTSSPEIEIQNVLDPLISNQAKIDLTSERVYADIEAYILESIKKDDRLNRWRGNDELQQKIRETLTTKASGMDHALKLLQLVTYSFHPLRIEELVDALAVDVRGVPRFDSRNRFKIPEEILLPCSSLVTIKLGGVYRGGRTEKEKTVHLAHFSVKEYLVSNIIDTRVAETYNIQEIPSHITIAETCLAYILLFDQPGSSISEIKDKFPLAEYSAERWADEESSELIKSLMDELFRNKTYAFNVCVDLSVRFWSFETKRGNREFLLYYSCSRGLFQATERLLNNGADINFHTWDYGSALQIAVKKKNQEIVQLLLDRGADSSIEKEYRPVLHIAITNKDQEIVKLLLDRGADPNFGRTDGTALRAVVEYGNQEIYKIVQLLLDKGADRKKRH
ncbi:MAG: hypothetical protein M1834_007063 [Cirrosporium novae-zelandiae]|nr:MAG: hypothetical protein M1834_007063 [Cirrosporium novae-zelandiae]